VLVRLLEVVQSEGKVREREQQRERERDGGDGVGHSLVLQLLPQFPRACKTTSSPFYGSSDVLSFTPTIPMGFAKPLHPPFQLLWYSVVRLSSFDPVINNMPVGSWFFWGDNL
jgi:hypothetical protein